LYSFKSLRQGGINFGFIKHFWEEIKDDMFHFITEFHQNGRLAKGINYSFNALIPKVDRPQCLSNFRSISLVGCMYKVLAKLLANKLRNVIGSLIFDSQSTFVRGG